jgi:hypothetical protein
LSVLEKIDSLKGTGRTRNVSIGEWIIAWSIRIAMLLFVVVHALEWSTVNRPRIQFTLKVLWTASFLLFLLHVAAAFHFVHHWSHDAAYIATANETREKMGFAYGTGVYFNYLFLLVWAIDVAMIWLGKSSTSVIQKYVRILGRCYLLFIAFNGVIVFKSGWLRVIGLLATVMLMVLAFRFYRRLKPNVA